MLGDALLLQLGYNATLVAIGATLLGVSAGVTGTFLFLRKRALVSDDISHATLPGGLYPIFRRFEATALLRRYADNVTSPVVLSCAGLQGTREDV
ncbi:MAG: metal ABC transporter permease, partial [Pseudomonadota bacterium]